MKKNNKIILLFAVLACFLSGSTVLAYQNPTANAGPDLYVTSGFYNANPSATLQGSGFDPNGSFLNFHWSCTDGSLSNYNVPQPIFTAPSGVWQSLIYTCTLTVTNNYGLSASDSALVYVNNNNNNNNYSNNSVNVQTNGATNIFNGQAVLNATISGNYYSGTIYGWFQWGTTTSYGYESNHRIVQYNGLFDQHIADLAPNTTYHFRVVVQGNFGTIYGQDMTFFTPNYGNVVIYNPPIYTPIYTPVYVAPQVAGASTISTGLTNNFWTDSFFLPLLIVLISLWFYFSGKAYAFADWLKRKS